MRHALCFLIALMLVSGCAHHVRVTTVTEVRTTVNSSLGIGCMVPPLEGFLARGNLRRSDRLVKMDHAERPCEEGSIAGTRSREPLSSSSMEERPRALRALARMLDAVEERPRSLTRRDSGNSVSTWRRESSA